MKTLLTTLSILLIATASYAKWSTEIHPQFSFFDVGPYWVERVVDGDTIIFTTANPLFPTQRGREGFQERVRLIGIDTPESRDNDKARRDAERTGQDLETITKMGQEATEFVKRFIKEGQEVRLEFDVQERDKYGRILAYVWYKLGPEYENRHMNLKEIYEISTKLNKQGTYDTVVFLNATIIKAGYATPMTIPPNVKYADLFKELYEEAREQKRGLWRHIVDEIGETLDYLALEIEMGGSPAFHILNLNGETYAYLTLGQELKIGDKKFIVKNLSLKNYKATLIDTSGKLFYVEKINYGIFFEERRMRRMEGE